MDEVHAIRDRGRPDIVMLIRSADSLFVGGKARLMTTVSTAFAASAFGVSIASTLTFAHELGHIMGLNHDRYVVHVACDGGICNRDGAFPYAYGYHHCDETSFTDRWRTIMAYANQCTTWRTPHRFSNPEQTYRSDPLGIAGLAPSTAVDGPSDAVRALNRTRAYVAKFRQAPDITVSFGAGSYTATEGGTAATVTVQLSAAPTRPIDIPLTAASTTATAYDYTGVPTSVHFSGNQTERTFTITAVDDAADEDDESVTLALGEPLPRNVTLGGTTETTVTLADNDTVTAAPSILSVELTSDPGSDGIYTLDDEIEASVRFNKTVTVTGEPQLRLRVGTLTHEATYRNSAGEVMRFVYTVADNDSDANGVSIDADSLLLNGGTIRDGDNQDAVRTHSAVAANANHRVDAVRPVFQSAKVNLTELILTYNEALDETSVPATSAFAVRVDGVGHGVTAVAVHGSEVTLTLSRAVAYGEDGATVSYTPGTPPLRDLLGNPATAVSDQTVTSEVPPYDTDTDGLIEITTVVQLNAVRYDLDGDGEPSTSGATTYSTAFPDASTPLRCAGGCTGYELSADLDFDAAGRWNSGRGWEPIGELSAQFDTTFEGNGHTIANLYVNRHFTSVIRGTPALFGWTTSSAIIRNVGLVDVNVKTSNIASGSALVGSNYGTITACYATGQVQGGYMGGLVTSNYGTITGSYAAVRVIGQNSTGYAGGLVGYNNGSSARITASYATGWVSGGIAPSGLVGTNSGTITGSYATGPVSGGTTPGGLVGANSGTITTSSWDTTTSGLTTSAGGTGRTTTALQASTGSTTTWDHGTASQYSALRGKGDWKEFGYQLRAGPTLTATGSATRVVLTWEVDTTPWDPDPPAVTYTVYRNTGSHPSTIAMIAENVSGLQYTTTGATDTYQIAAVVNGGEIVRSGWTDVVSAPNSKPTFPSTENGARSVAENTRANMDIGDPVAATDVDADTLTYSLSGTDADDFSINTSTGRLRTQAALDYETKDTYQVTVSVHDGTPDTTVDASIDVTITVTDVNETPAFSASSTTRSVAENTPRDQPIGDQVEATDPDTRTAIYATLSYRLSETDTAVFYLEPTTGQLQTRESLDFETEDTYRVTVEVRDDPDDPHPDDTIAVTITVVNVNEVGMVELPPSTPQEKQALTATLSDLDGLVAASIIWRWERSPNLNPGDWPDIPGATSSGVAMASYTPQAVDVGQYLRVTASYTDGHGMGKAELATTTDVVQAAPQVQLGLSASSITESGAGNTVTVTAELTAAAEDETEVRLSEMRDHYALSGTKLTIPMGATQSNAVTLTAKDNHVDGPEETKEVTVTGTLTKNLLVKAPDAVMLTITDDDARGVTVTPTELSVYEGASNTYKVVLTSEPTAPVTVEVTGPANPDVTVDRTELMFQPGSWNTAQPVKVEAAEDTGADDESATITHTVSGGDYTTTPALTVDAVAVTVEDDEDESDEVVLTVNRATVAEEAGRTTVTVTGTLNGAPRTGETEVNVTVSPGTATQGTDFAADPTSFTLTIPADARSEEASFVLTPENDRMDEPDETVTVRGSTTATGLTVTPATVTVTIEDNDHPPTVRLEVADNPIREDGDTTTLTARLLNGTSSAVTEITVTEPADAFTLDTNPLTIAPGGTTSSVTLTAVDNDVDARNKQVTVAGVVDNDQGVGRLETTTLTLIDDDPPVVSGLDAVRYTEGERQPVATYTATNPDPRNITISWSLEGADKDAFTTQNGVLRFAAAPDFERPRDVGEDNVYQVTVTATDTTSILGEPLTGPGLAVIVTVADAPGRINLPRTPPQIGAAFTAKLDDPDGVGVVTAWCWERSLYRDFPPAGTDESHCDATTTATYTPVDADLDHYLRATATYTDSDGTEDKPAMGVSEALVTDRPQSPPPRPPGGGPPSGGGPPGGGGGQACADDVHGNQATQATDIALSAETAGAICPAADVDYFTVTAPGQGLVFVDTFGGVQTRGTLWQNGVVLASGSTGRPPDDRLGALVQAGPVVVVLQGQGGATGPYAVEITFVRGYLENPGPESFQSGVGVLSGWVCAAERVEIELNGVPQEAAYGTERLDTAGVCGDTDNGFGLLFNWNLLRDGEHEVVAFVDGVELGRASVTVTTLGQEFLRDVTGTCEAEDFPTLGERVTLVWQQNSQNFVIAEGSPPTGATTGRTSALTGFLENPGHNSFQSGVRVLSGWVCEADTVELAIGHLGRQEAAYGTERLDTQGACGDTDNGFGLLFNWNRLGEGEHAVVAFVDGVELGQATVRVTTVGEGAEEEFLRGAEGECMVEDFPMPGEKVTLEWQQNSQNFVITDVE